MQRRGYSVAVRFHSTTTRSRSAAPSSDSAESSRPGSDATAARTAPKCASMRSAVAGSKSAIW